MMTLQWFRSSTRSVTLANERYCGINEGLKMSYEMADDAVLYWAGIYAGPKVDVES